jgi:hypothetical protein
MKKENKKENKSNLKIKNQPNNSQEKKIFPKET